MGIYRLAGISEHKNADAEVYAGLELISATMCVEWVLGATRGYGCGLPHPLRCQVAER